MAYLRILTGTTSGTTVPITEGRLTLGRGEQSTIRLSDQGASRRHAEIFRNGELYFIRDLGSRNGTFVNERKVGEGVLREGDKVRIGDTVLAFQLQQGASHSRVLRLDSSSRSYGTVRFRDTMPGSRLARRPEEEKKAKDLRARVTQIIAGEGRLQALLDRIVREVGEALGGDRAELLWIDSLQPEVHFREVATFDTKGEGEVAVSKSILGEVVERQEAILIADAVADERFSVADSVVSHSMRSVICVPVITAGVTTAVLYIFTSQRAQAFDREDLAMAQQVGMQLGALFSLLRILDAREAVLRRALELAVGCRGPAEGTESGRGMAVARISRAIAHSLALPPEEAAVAWSAGMLHESVDVHGGGALGRETPAAIGADPILDAIACQDERHDGSGSPQGRVGEEIPLLGRILALAKEVDRLRREQETKGRGAGEGKGADLDAVLAAIRDSAGGKFHPEVVQACLVAHRNGLLDSDASLPLPGLGI